MRRAIPILLAMCLLASLSAAAEPPAGKYFPGNVRMVFPRSSRNSIMESVVAVTPNRHVIVFDGGHYADADHLAEVILQYSDTVDYWFLSHAHSDHCGAIIELAKKRPDALKIAKVLYAFPPQQWLAETEAWSKAETRDVCTGVAALPWPQVELHKGDRFEVDGAAIDVLNFYDLNMTQNSCNNSSLVFSLRLGGRRLIFPGDIGVEMANVLVEEYGDGLKADIVVLSHHGQNGASRQFYEKVAPEIAIWQTPDWLWDNDNGGGPGSGSWQTNYVKCWMQELGVKRQFRNTDDIVLE
ncbi:MAG: MBL fold metallo-hydrolase [Victivallales bacterium]|nr:MBL fold metallo-hydrolase [Victivallales bacterium]